MIEARAVRTVSSLAPAGRLDGFELVVNGGLHALVGSPGDGVSLALAALAGRTRLQHGQVRIDGASPRDRPEALVWLGRAPAFATLPGAMRVDAVIALAASVRGGRTQGSPAALSQLGVEALASRALRSLSRSDTRAVALAIALAADARVLLLDEPLLDLEPDVANRAVHALRQRARDSAAVIVGTASEREARRLGAEVHRLRGGRIVAASEMGVAGVAGAVGAVGAVGAACVAGVAGAAGVGGGALGRATFRAVSSDARALLGSLAEEEAIATLESHGSAVQVGGADAALVAAAIGRAAVRADVDLVSLERLESGGAP